MGLRRLHDPGLPGRQRRAELRQLRVRLREVRRPRDVQARDDGALLRRELRLLRLREVRQHDLCLTQEHLQRDLPQVSLKAV